MKYCPGATLFLFGSYPVCCSDLAKAISPVRIIKASVDRSSPMQLIINIMGNNNAMDFFFLLRTFRITSFFIKMVGVVGIIEGVGANALCTQYIHMNNSQINVNHFYNLNNVLTFNLSYAVQSYGIFDQYAWRMHSIVCLSILSCLTA